MGFARCSLERTEESVMSSCSNCEYWERLAKQRYWEIDRLKSENDTLYSKLNKAEHKIESELAPRIQQEKKGYDAWVTDPQNHVEVGEVNDE